ncbi:hypothetical protein CDLVIII_2412 [Clostridium sp. DL-VIII]|uniref:hypothetical protein n=1 Tax=Clostridium sp. DL-VIII TaxID=641107 RepID=UPI00023AFE8A|nr:hypothetical protein [Clostridium sp. DL-VIII]EHI99057.1 hypothetical protein CDLVIII_2412 [Clostridium sp. DL-VIII]
MIKIELDDLIEEEHKNYYNDFVKVNFDKSIYCNKKGVEEFNKKNGTSYDTRKIKKIHKEFMNFCKKNSEILSTGTVDELRKLDSEINKDYHDIKVLIEKKFRCRDTGKGKVDTYHNLLLKIFGYEKFSSITIWESILEVANKNIKSKLSKDKEVYDNLLGILEKANFKLADSQKKELEKKTSNKERKAFLESCFTLELTLDNFHKNNFNGIWNAYIFLLNSKIRVCPYCNRQYIAPIYTDSGKMRATLDHFFPKVKFPYFSMSLYNLIPSCGFCNSSLKGSKQFDENDLNPYEKSFDDYAKFYANIISKDNIKIEVIDTDKKDVYIENYKNTFKLEHQYSYHTNQVEELIYKRLAYSKSRIEDFMDNEYKKLDITQKELIEILVGFKKDKFKINNEPLAKLRRDVAIQLGFFEDSESTYIKELKKILNK